MAIEKIEPPPWYKTEDVEVTCVAANDETLCVFMFWRVESGEHVYHQDNLEDMFVLTCNEDVVLVNGAPIDASNEDQELLCRMTDATIMGPNGPAIGVPIITNAGEFVEFRKGHDGKQD